MSTRLNHKVAAITGAGSGIGRAIAIQFAREGAKVALLDLDETQVKETLALIEATGGSASVYVCDVASQSSVETTFARLIKDMKTIHILVNNAGIAHVGTIEQCSSEDLDRIYQINIKGVYLCMKYAIEHMKSHGGSIINMASVASHVGIPDRFAYSMSKGAVFTMTQSIATDYIDFGIRCNSISPARVHTPFVDGFIAKNYPDKKAEMFDKLSKSQPIGRMGKPEEIAHLAVYLASDESSFTTGSDFAIDGGFIKVKKA